MAQVTEDLVRDILNGQGYTNNEVKQLAHFWLKHNSASAEPTVNQSLADAEQAQEPVMADGKTKLSDYLEAAAPDDEITDEWTKGYEACKRQLFKIVGHQLRMNAPAQPAKACRHKDGCPDMWKCSSAIAGDCGARIEPAAPQGEQQ